jgi:hypothetical protein
MCHNHLDNNSMYFLSSNPRDIIIQPFHPKSQENQKWTAWKHTWEGLARGKTAHSNTPRLNKRCPVLFKFQVIQVCPVQYLGQICSGTVLVYVKFNIFLFCSFIHMCTRCLGHFSILSHPHFQAGPVLPLSLILLKKRHKHNKEDKAFLLGELRVALQRDS